MGLPQLLLSSSLLSDCRREQLESSQAAWLAQAEKYENTHLGGYRRIYPACGTDKYEPFFKHSGSLFQETVASKAREECARYIDPVVQSSPLTSLLGTLLLPKAWEMVRA